MPRRKLISIRKFMERKGLGRRLTRQKQGLVYNRLRRTGRVCAVPLSAPPQLERSWLDPADPRVLLAQKAAAGATVSADQLATLPQRNGSFVPGLNDAGIAALPAGEGRVHLVGTSPRLARIANQIFHGRRRRWLHRRELIEAVFGICPNGRATVVTERRLEYALCYFNDEFGCDLSDLIDHEEVLIGRGGVTC